MRSCTPLLSLAAGLLVAAPTLGAQQGPSSPPAEQVYFEFQVERPATTLPGGCSPVIPKGHDGEVQVQFVVDSLGKPEPGSVKVLLASHPSLEKAVRKAIPCMRYRAASIDGRPVRQLVQQSFSFHHK